MCRLLRGRFVMNEKVSVVFPVGPRVDRAGMALDDLMRQSWRDLEILAVLNGCPDDVRRDFLGRQDSRLRVIDLGGEPQLLRALDIAIAESSGRWLARMDADDRCHESRIEKQVRFLIDGRFDVVSCGIELVDPLGDGMRRYVDWVNGLKTPEDVARERFVESPVVQPTVILSRELFESVGGYRDNELAEDYDLWLRLLHAGARFGKETKKLYRWHDRSDRLTRSDPRFGHKRMLALKADALARLPGVRKNGVVISGAGPNGKVIGRELIALGIEVRGYFEVDPKRVGRTCQGAPIAGSGDFGKIWRDAVLLSAVGVASGREKVRAMANREGYEEGEDFWCCC